MSSHFGATKYRAVLGEKTAPELAIVVVQDNGSISWSAVSEQEYNTADCDDLPNDLFEQVNSAYASLKSLDDPVDDDDVMPNGEG